MLGRKNATFCTDPERVLDRSRLDSSSTSSKYMHALQHARALYLAMQSARGGFVIYCTFAAQATHQDNEGGRIDRW